jgi:hypothetical protein
MAIPHYVNENKSDMWSIKPGWYAMAKTAAYLPGRFSSREECLNRSTQPTNGSTSAKLRLRPR